jgi:SNF2 family DNA or RNA helicase
VLSEHDQYGWQCRLANRVGKVVRAKEDKGVLVFVDMGQGKTAPSLTAIVDTIDDFVVDQVLVVAPIRICEDVWRQEARKWEHARSIIFSLVRGNPADRAFALARKADVYLINPEHLDWLWTHLRGSFKRFQLIFVDESSLFKNPRSKRFKTLKKIKDKFEERITFIPMSGTPTPQSIMDIWPQVYMVDGGRRLGATFTTFRERFFKRGRSLAEHVYEWEPEPDAFEQIKELVADITLELSADEKKKFPVVEKDHWIDLPTKIREKYDFLEKEMIFEWEGSEVIAKHGGAKSIMLRQMASGAIYKNRLLDEDFNLLHDEKIDYLLELLEELNRPVMIAYEFRHDLARIRAALTKARGGFTVMAENDTNNTVEAWNAGRIRNLLIHRKSAGYGLNMQGGSNHVVWFSECWSQGDHDQVVARLARNGQEADQVFNHHIRARDTVETLMEISRRVKGDEQTRFRTALRIYQAQKGLV